MPSAVVKLLLGASLDAPAAVLLGRLAGVALWPAVILHVAMAVWCLACLRCGRTNPGNGATP